METDITITHHGGHTGVTGSCHQLTLPTQEALLVDCGLFQGAEIELNPNELGEADSTAITFPLDHIHALLITHCHIDHVGRIPYLLIKGWNKPIYATEATAKLLPLIIEDAVRLGITRDIKIIEAVSKKLKRLLKPIPYKQWFAIEGMPNTRCKFKPAGHILGSAYIECDAAGTRVVFSGDLGAPYSPLLPAPKSPWKADILVLESTYGDKRHQGRKERTRKLQQIIEKCLQNRGAVLIPAFSIGRTQELLYELEEIIYQQQKTHSAIRSEPAEGEQTHSNPWHNIDIILDSPMAAKFTQHYQELSHYWDKEAKRKLKRGRHPLAFENLTTIEDHQQHQWLVSYLKTTARPAIVIAASGMCTGGRMMNYLKALLPDPRADVLFVGYQAQGTAGREIQKYGPRGGYVYLDGNKIDIKASVHTISGYSAHADQNDLIKFVKRMWKKPKEIRLVHGDEEAKRELQNALSSYSFSLPAP